MPLDLSRFEAIDWDDDDDENGNLAHCRRPGHLGSNRTAQFAIVGPDRSRHMWVVLLDVSHKRGDFLRPVTGWPASANARAVWLAERRTGGTLAVWLPQ